MVTQPSQKGWQLNEVHVLRTTTTIHSIVMGPATSYAHKLDWIGDRALVFLSCFSVFVCLRVRLFVCQSVGLFVWLSVWVFVRLLAWLCACVFRFVSVFVWRILSYINTLWAGAPLVDVRGLLYVAPTFHWQLASVFLYCMRSCINACCTDVSLMLLFQCLFYRLAHLLMCAEQICHRSSWFMSLFYVFVQLAIFGVHAHSSVFVLYRECFFLFILFDLCFCYTTP